MGNLADGPGVPGNFLGLDERFALYGPAAFAVLPVPFELTTSYQQGTAHGPAAIIEASRNIEGYDVETECEAFVRGVFTAPPIMASSSEEMIARTRNETSRFIADGKVPIILGGEHSISQAPVCACAEHYDRFSVLQFDAHTDLRPAYNGNPFSHASVMSRIHEIPQLASAVAVGIRAMDIDERSYIDRKDLFLDHEIQGDDTWMDRVIERLAPQVYVTFDIDVFSSAIMPSTGTPEPGGLDWFRALRMLRKVCMEREVIGFDVVELMPLDGFDAPNFLAAKLVYKFINYKVLSQKEVA